MASDVHRLEVVYAPGVRTFWALEVTDYVDGSTGVTARQVASTMLKIEQLIEARIAQIEDNIERVVYTLGGRDIFLRDNSRIEFRWELHVADWRCLDCGIDTDSIEEYYMLHNELWEQVHPDTSGHLCIGCVEIRLGRTLTAADFTDAAVNTDESYQRSARLTDRLERIGEAQTA